MKKEERNNNNKKLRILKKIGYPGFGVITATKK